MEEQAKLGTVWQADELDLIVADYFAMLSADVSGLPYVKSSHSRVLMAKIGRSHRSVEFKHQNISAVLDELGMPWIPGYKPKSNYQNAIFDAIDRYLSSHTEVLDPTPKSINPPPTSPEVFISPPHVSSTAEKVPERLRQLVAKFDPVKRDHENRVLGKAGEAFVVDVERQRLESAGRADLARMIRWTAEVDGDGAGYDVASFNLEGQPQLIEVKTTNGSARTPFFLTRNEMDTAKRFPIEWQIYRVHLFANDPRIFKLSQPLEQMTKLTTETWRASF